eukprot:gene3929-7842_t
MRGFEKLKCKELTAEWRRESLIISTYLMIFIGSILCFLPQFFQWKLNPDSSDSLDSYPLWTAMASNNVSYALIASIASSFPILFDFIADMYSTMTGNIYQAKYAVWMMLMSSMIPNLFTIFYIVPNFEITILPVIIPASTIYTLCGACFLLNAYAPKIWKIRHMITVIASYTVGSILMAAKPFSSDTIHTEYYVLIVIFTIIPLLLLLHPFTHFIRLIRTRGTNKSVLTFEDVCISFNAIGVVFLLVYRIFLGPFANHNAPFEPLDWSPAFLTFHFVIVTAYTLAVASFNGRVIRHS